MKVSKNFQYNIGNNSENILYYVIKLCSNHNHADREMELWGKKEDIPFDLSYSHCSFEFWITFFVTFSAIQSWLANCKWWRKLKHSLSQKGVWVPFGQPNPQKSSFRTPNCFGSNFLKCQFQAWNWILFNSISFPWHCIKISCLISMCKYMFMIESLVVVSLEK